MIVTSFVIPVYHIAPYHMSYPRPTQTPRCYLRVFVSVGLEVRRLDDLEVSVG